MTETIIKPDKKPHLVIEPSKGWSALNLREVWQYRDLLLSFASRDIKLRYRQTALGPIWIVLAPLMSAGLFSFILGNIAKLPSDGVNYFLFIYSGQMAWNLFSGMVAKTQGSLVANSALVSKVYFPRLVLPLSSLFSLLLDFGVALVVLAGLMAVKGVVPYVGLPLLPVWLLFLLLMALGIGLFAAALTVSYRDVSSALNPLIQLLQYASGVVLAASALPHALRPFYYLNPMASLIEAFRWSLLGTNAPPWGYVAYAAVVSILVFLGGAFAFKRMERKFADVI